MSVTTPLTALDCVVVIPARNERAAIRAVVIECLQYVPRVIVVDDASIDGTAEQLTGLSVTVLRSDTQLGKGAALLKGFSHAVELGARAIITLDGDGQHDPADIPAFIAAANAYPQHLIGGARLKNINEAPTKRWLANRIADFWIAWASGQALRDSQCGMRLYPCALLQRVPITAVLKQSFVFESEILILAVRAGFPLVSVPIAARYPAGARASHFRPVRDIWRITCMVFWKIVLRGLYLTGLFRSLYNKPLVFAPGAHTSNSVAASNAGSA